MKTYTTRKVGGFTLRKLGDYTLYVSDDTGRVHHAVDYTSRNPVTLYPYAACRSGGYDNVCGELTVTQTRSRYSRGTLIFR